jgi:hypothetical protein
MTLTEKKEKEKPHVVDHHHNSGNPVAARLFRWKHKFKIPENRQLDSCSDCRRHHTHPITAPWGG